VQIPDETTYAAGDQTITNNGLGVGRISFSANTGTGSILQLRANGQNDATPQTLTYGNNVLISGANGVYGIIDVGRQGGTGTQKTLALGNLTTGPNGGALRVTGESDYSLAIGSVTITGTSKGATFNPTTANLRIGSVGNTGTTLNTLILNGTTTGNTITGTIANGTAPTAVTQGGSSGNTGTWSLNGNSTYSGNTSINYGTLRINGDNSAATGAVTVANSATLGGKGIVGGATTVNNGCTLAPGDGGPGTLTFSGNLNLAGSTSKMLFEGGDLVVVNGALSLASAWNLAVTGSDFRDGGSVVLFNYASAGTLNLNADIDVSGLDFTPTGALSLTDTGSSIVLNGISSIYGISKGTVLSIR
jgi:fibronectin-binding autotransporter adhesin